MTHRRFPFFGPLQLSLLLALVLAWLPQASLAQSPGKVDPQALAKAAVAESRLPDPGGKVVKQLAAAVMALPPWAPFYAGAKLGLDSNRDAPGTVQVSFSTRDSEETVARFYLERLSKRAKPDDLREPGVRTIEVSNAKGDQITSVILQPRAGGGVSGLIRHEGGGY